MKKLILLYALLVSFTSTIAQNIDKLKKRELRELANTQKKQLEIKNSKIDDQITTIDDQISTIDDQATVIKNSSARITALIQIQTELQNITLLNQKSINKLNTNNAIIPGLKNEIIKLTDSINSIKKLKDASQIADNIASNLNLQIFEKQELLEITDLKKRLEKINELVEKETSVISVEKKNKR